MENNVTAEEKLLRQAEELVKARRGFRTHLMVYICVNAGLTLIWLITKSGADFYFDEPYRNDFWPVWSIVGWGIGLLAHGIGVYGKLPGKTLEEEIQAEYKRLKNKAERQDGINP